MAGQGIPQGRFSEDGGNCASRGGAADRVDVYRGRCGLHRAGGAVYVGGSDGVNESREKAAHVSAYLCALDPVTISANAARTRR